MSAVGDAFFVTGGTLRHDAPSYVERQADRDLLKGLLAGAFCYVLTSRQMGKSSLMVRTATKLRERGVEVVVLDLTAIGQNVTPEQWFDGLLLRMAGQLRLENELEAFWETHPRLSPVQRFFQALHDVVLKRHGAALVVFVDEIDVVRSLPFSTDEFFAAIRELYNRRTEHEPLRRVSFCLLGVAAPGDLIRDTRMTPFNIGRRIELHDFTREEALPLARGLAAGGGIDDATARAALARVLHWTRGHPYLTQRFCQALASRPTANPQAVDAICDELFLSNRARDQDDNLLFVRDRLLRGQTDPAGLLMLYRDVLRGRPPVPDDVANPLVGVLRLSGIARSENGRLRVRNEIYARDFDREWIDANMPDAELRRQRAAFYRGVIRTTAIAAVVVAAMAIAVVSAVTQEARARRSLAQAYFSQAQSTRKSGLAGQRHESLGALDKARHNHTNAAALRDEALACLALVDLRGMTNGMDRLTDFTLAEWSPDMEIAAEAGEGGAIILRRRRNRQMLASLPGSGLPVERLRFSPRDSVLVAEYRGPTQNQVVAWNWQTGRRLFAAAHGVSGEAIDFSADGRKLALGDRSGRVTVFALPHGKIVQTFDLELDSGAPRPPQSIRFHPAGGWLAASSLDDQQVELWTLGVTQRLARLYHAGVVRDLAWHPGGHQLAAACGDSRVYLWHTNNFWQTNSFQNAKKLAGHEDAVSAVAFNQWGTVLASLGNDQTVRLWIPATERQMAGSMEGESFDRLRFSADDRRLIASSRKPPRVRAWDAFGGELSVLQAQTDRGDDVRTIDFSPDSRWLLAASGKQITFWQTGGGQELGSVPIDNAHAAWFAADGGHLVVSSDSGLYKRSLLLVEAASPPQFRTGATQRLHRVVGEPDATARLEWGDETSARPNRKALDSLGMMAMSLDRSMAAVVQQDDVLLVPLELPGAASLSTRHLGVHHPQLALHPQAKWLVTQSGDSNVLHLLNLSDAAGKPSPTTVPGSSYFAFSPDGQWLASCLAGVFQFYRVGEWREPAFVVPRTLASDQHAPVAFSRDSNTVALASSRYSIQLRRLPESGLGEAALIATLESPDRLPLEILAFSPDNRYLAAGTDGQIVLLWNLSSLGEYLAGLGLRRDWPEPRRATPSNQHPDLP